MYFKNKNKERRVRNKCGLLERWKEMGMKRQVMRKEKWKGDNLVRLYVWIYFISYKDHAYIKYYY